MDIYGIYGASIGHWPSIKHPWHQAALLAMSGSTVAPLRSLFCSSCCWSSSSWCVWRSRSMSCTVTSVEIQWHIERTHDALPVSIICTSIVYIVPYNLYTYLHKYEYVEYCMQIIMWNMVKSLSTIIEPSRNGIQFGSQLCQSPSGLPLCLCATAPPPPLVLPRSPGGLASPGAQMENNGNTWHIMIHDDKRWQR